MQYLPENGLYVYFRYSAAGTVLVDSNTTDQAATLPTARFSERLAGFRQARDVLTGATLPDVFRLALPAKTAVVLELLKYQVDFPAGTHPAQPRPPHASAETGLVKFTELITKAGFVNFE